MRAGDLDRPHESRGEQLGVVVVTVELERDGTLVAHVGWSREHEESPTLELLMATAVTAMLDAGNEMFGGFAAGSGERGRVADCGRRRRHA